MLKKFFSEIFDVVFPHICVGCNEEAIPSHSIFCAKCAGSLPYTRMENICHNEFEKHFTGRLHIQAGCSTFFFSKGGIMQNAIHALKYRNLPHVGRALGAMMGRKLAKNPTYKSCDVVIGVPLHKSKKRKRGYNQTDFIAEGISNYLKIPHLDAVINRGRNTHSQTRKSRLQRMKNLQGGFSVLDPEKIEGKHILLVDDVLTSGATLDYCGQAILSVENTKLSLATAAMGGLV